MEGITLFLFNFFFFLIKLKIYRFKTKAEKSKFHSMKLESFKKLLGVPLEHIGKPSKLEKLVHENVQELPGTFFVLYNIYRKIL
jgi:hypothetical protein